MFKIIMRILFKHYYKNVSFSALVYSKTSKKYKFLSQCNFRNWVNFFIIVIVLYIYCLYYHWIIFFSN